MANVLLVRCDIPNPPMIFRLLTSHKLAMFIREYTPIPLQDLLCRPLGVASLYPLLVEGGHNVKILDLATCKPYKRKKIMIKHAKRYDLIGFSFVTRGYPEAINLAKLSKKVNPDAKIVFGGPHATFTFDEILKKHWFIDYVVRGDGEKVLPSLCENLDSDVSKKNILGVAYRKNKKIIFCPPNWVNDLNPLPFPAREKCEPIDYRYSNLETIEMARGCPMKCSFCLSSRSPIRYKNPKKIVDEIESIISWKVRIKKANFDFVGSPFYISYLRMKKLCIELKRRDVKFNYMGTKLCVDTTTARFLKMLKSTNFSRVAFGVETLNPFSLVYVNKTKNPYQYKMRCIKLLKYARKIGLSTTSFYIIGLPYQTRKSVIKELRILRKLSDIVISVFTPFPGTTEWERMKDKLTTEDFSKFDLLHNVIKSELSEMDMKTIQKTFLLRNLRRNIRNLGLF